MLNVFDLLVQLIVERSKVHSNVLIGGASAARLWQRLLRVSLVDGIGTGNAPHILRGILTSFRECLEESFIYPQVAEQRNECTRLIQVNNSPHMDATHLLLSAPFLQGMLVVLDPPPPPDYSFGESDDSSDNDQPPQPPRPPWRPPRIHEWKAKKRVKLEDSRKGIVGPSTLPQSAPAGAAAPASADE